MPFERDCLIVGSGIAGTAAALRLARDTQRQVALVTRAHDPEESNTRHAQGGIVARGTEDSAELLVEDVLRGTTGGRAASITARMQATTFLPGWKTRRDPCHDWSTLVTNCGRCCIDNRKIDMSTVRVGSVNEV
jgi:glycine/D-amino acid oxidase-like deaminating enzyme